MKLNFRSRQNSRFKKKVFLILCVFAIIFSVCFKIIKKSRKDFITFFSHRQPESIKTKKILIWTTFFSKNIIENHRKCLSKCDAMCVVTDNTNEVSSADAVLFHLTDLWKKSWDIGTKEIVDLPVYRHPGQAWVLWNLEPPVHLFGNLGIFNGLFNWTMFYRSDSTIWSPYGAAAKLNDMEIARARDKMKNRNIFREKEDNFDIVGRISNCRDEGRRYKLVSELRKYLNVDMYGLCYDKPCGKVLDWNDSVCDEVLKKYKFYLAFENSYCTDYLTEKYWLSLQRDQIPIVNWKEMNTNIPIPGSYINIFDFQSIKDAAEYIQQVGDNETLYNSYFKWKLEYKNDIACPGCQLCRALHDKSRPAQVYKNIEAWVQDDTCEQVGKFNFFWRHMKWNAYWMFGI